MFNWGPGQHVEQETSRRKIVQDVGSDNQCPKAGAYARNYVSRPGRNRGNVHWTGMDLVHQSLPRWRGVCSQSLACPDLHFLQAHVWVLPGVLQRYESFTLSCPIPQVGKLVAS